ncbi:MAG: hypothetical protein HKO91_06275 [Desulfobacterales bacterium]|nr:hypothetical protein [Desulfobacterales bacterium]
MNPHEKLVNYIIIMQIGMDVNKNRDPEEVKRMINSLLKMELIQDIKAF